MTGILGGIFILQGVSLIAVGAGLSRKTVTVQTPPHDMSFRRMPESKT
jgi:hypothetical protein